MMIENNTALEKYLEDVKNRMQEKNPIAECILKKFQEIEEKLPGDMKSLSTQYLMLFGLIFEQADNDSEFATQLLLPWKSWERLYRYMDAKARPTSKDDKSFHPRCAMVDSFTLLSWITEYYALDDKEDFEKEVAEKEKREQERLEHEKKLKELREKAKSHNTKAIPSEKEENDEDSEDDDETDSETTVTPIIKKKSNRDCDGQIDFLSLLGD